MCTHPNLFIKDRKSQKDLVPIRLAKIKIFVKVVDGLGNQEISQIIGIGVKCCHFV